MINQNVLPSSDDVRFFEENGYWLSKKVISDERLERLHEAMDRVYAGEHETGIGPWMGGWKPGGDPLHIRKSDNAHWCNNTIRALATDPTIGVMLARLMKTDEVRLWHDQLLYKPGQGPQAQSLVGNVGWHQDHHYWQCTAPDLVTAWVAFDDVTLENGCMKVVPGSHHWGLINEGNFFEPDLEKLEKKITGSTGREFRTAACTLKAGEVSFHHCLTLHGSGPNYTNAPRRSLVIHAMPAHACYIGGTPGDGHMNVVLLKELGGKAGDLFKGKWWPVLYPQNGTS